MIYYYLYSISGSEIVSFIFAQPCHSLCHHAQFPKRRVCRVEHDVRVIDNCFKPCRKLLVVVKPESGPVAIASDIPQDIVLATVQYQETFSDDRETASLFQICQQPFR